MELLPSRRFAEGLLLAVILFHVVLSPYAKVEESFNLQAIHDLLFFFPPTPANIAANFDHLEFPGVVPRTFVGPIAVAVLTAPFRLLTLLLEDSGWCWSKAWFQIGCRCVLGTCSWVGMRSFLDGVSFQFGADAAAATALVTASQFHLPFYLSRTLPNTFALVLVLVGLGRWLKGRVDSALALLTLATVVFRCDVLVLLGPLVLQLLLTRRVGLWHCAWTGISAGLLGLVICVPIDTYFWQQLQRRGTLLWAEGSVLLFNTVENHSSEWGTSPPTWYLTSALPRALSLTLPLVPLGLLGPPPAAAAGPGRDKRLVDVRLLSFVLPALAMVLLYSALPHKELRFIFPALPLLNLAAGVALAKAVRAAGTVGSAKKDGDDERTWGNLLPKRVVLVSIYGCLAGTCATSTLFSIASSWNYPGGVALSRLHTLVERQQQQQQQQREVQEGAGLRRPPVVHIDVPAAMSGVSRFGQLFLGQHATPLLEYSKREDVQSYEEFDWLITAEPYASGKSLAHFSVVEEVQGFGGIELLPSEKRLRLRLEPQMYIMSNKKNTAETETKTEE